MGLTLNEAVDLMRGPVGSEITITIAARGHRRAVRRLDHPRHHHDRARSRSRLEDDTVVLRVTTFNEQTFPSLEEQLAEQVEAAGGMDKVNGFVLDLRNNPGGLLNQAIYGRPTPSSTRARSSRPAAATRATASATTRRRATSPRASRWSS